MATQPIDVVAVLTDEAQALNSLRIELGKGIEEPTDENTAALELLNNAAKQLRAVRCAASDLIEAVGDADGVRAEHSDGSVRVCIAAHQWERIVQAYATTRGLE